MSVYKNIFTYCLQLKLNYNLKKDGNNDNMHFIHEITWLLMQIKALIVLIICMLSYFKYTCIILHNFMLWSKNTSTCG